MDVWAQMTPFNLVGLTAQAPQAAHAGATTAIPGVARSSGPALVGGTTKPWHPDSPLFWFGVIAAATFGLIGASTSVRVGPAKAAVSVGDS